MTGRDELGELANDIDAMLEALEASHRSQRGLVNGSPDLLLRAVNNLLANAVKWSPPGA